ncbi:MAG: hypothetical protein ACRDZ9_05295 [Acidimicrobiales bacterium]
MAADEPVPSDPVRDRRARAKRLAVVGQRLGAGLFGVAVALFVAGLLAGFTDLLAAAVTACLVAGSVVLAPAIILGFAVGAADRDDRRRGT